MSSCRAPGRRDREADRWRRLSCDTAAMPRPVGILDVGIPKGPLLGEIFVPSEPLGRQTCTLA